MKNWKKSRWSDPYQHGSNWRRAFWPDYSKIVTYPDREPDPTDPPRPPRKTKSIEEILKACAKQWAKENPNYRILTNRELPPPKEPELSLQIFMKEQDIERQKQWYERNHKKLTLEEQMKEQELLVDLERELEQLQTRYDNEQKDKQ